MEKKKWITIMVTVTILSISLFILFVILFIREKRKNEYKGNMSMNCEQLQKRSETPVNYFPVEKDTILVSFNEELIVNNPSSFTFEFDLEPNSEGIIVSNRVAKKGWSFGISPKRRLIFTCNSEKIESIEIEQIDERIVYSLVYDGVNLQIKRNDIEVARGKIKIDRGVGPLLLGMGFECNPLQSGKKSYSSICKSTNLIKAKFYRAKFTIDGMIQGSFLFDSGRSVFTDPNGRIFVKREVNDFIFETEQV